MNAEEAAKWLETAHRIAGEHEQAWVFMDIATLILAQAKVCEAVKELPEVVIPDGQIGPYVYVRADDLAAVTTALSELREVEK